MKNGEITEGEIADAKLALIDSAGRVGDSTNSLMNWYFACVMNEEILTPEEKIERFRAVTKDEIVRMAQRKILLYEA